MLIISCATAAEAGAIRKKLRITGQQSLSRCPGDKRIFAGQRDCPGGNRCRPPAGKTGCPTIIDHLKPAYVVLMGAAGAAAPGLKLGDIVIIEQILRKEGPIHDTKRTGVSSTYCCHTGLNTAAQQVLLQAGIHPCHRQLPHGRAVRPSQRKKRLDTQDL